MKIEISAGTDYDASHLERLTVNLRTELLQLDVDNVQRASAGPAPQGSKGPSADSVGTLLITLSDSATIAAVVSLLQSWITRDRGRSVTIKLGEDMIEVRKVPNAELTALIESWIKDHEQR